MIDDSVYSWRDGWVRWSVGSVCAISVISIIVGFIWLPSAQGDFSAQGLWASICRAAGVPGQWSDNSGPAAMGQRSTSVVLTEVAAEGMARRGREAAVGRGATLAQPCAACHGAKGVSDANAPNLAGQHAEVVMKQLIDYRRGDRSSAVMQALASGLSETNMWDLAAYYADLPKPHAVPHVAAAPALVRVGDPMRNIAPCAACHAGQGHKLGAAWLEGMPKEYLALQLKDFASGARRNDSHAQMRNVARSLSATEIDAIADFYARARPP